jgi:hypothetical protein
MAELQEQVDELAGIVGALSERFRACRSATHPGAPRFSRRVEALRLIAECARAARR